MKKNNVKIKPKLCGNSLFLD